MSDAQSIHPDDLLAHAEALRRLAGALLHDESLAEDVVQQAFLTALERTPRSPGALGAWLRRVVRHKAIAFKLSRERSNQRERDVARAESIPCHVKTVEALALQRDVVEALSALPEPYRTVIYQRYYEDLPPRAIAERQGAPVKTVKTQLWRGLEMLRARFDVKHGDRRIWAATLVPIAQGKLVIPASAAALTAPAAGMIGMKLQTVVGLGVGLALVAGALFLVAGGWIPESDSSALVGSAEPVRQPAARRQETPLAPAERARRALVTEPFAEQEGQTPATGRLLVHCAWSDGTPAADVHVIVHATDDLRLLGKQRFVTDVDGRVLATELRPGRFTVLTDRGTTMRTRVHAGELAEVRLEFGRGVDVKGVVVDPGGKSVAGAQVYLAGGNLDWSAGFPIAQCGPDGQFLLRSIEPEDSLWASAPLHGPSEVLDLEHHDVSSGSIEVELTLSASGAAVRGRVVDDAGHAVAGARIALGVPTRDYLETRVDGSRIEVRVPRIATSDEAGLFSFEGVAPGHQLVVVHAEGWPIWRREMTVEPPHGPTLLIQLERGVIVRGVVREESDDPVEGAVVLALPAPFHDPVPGQGPGDKGLPFPHPATRTDARGAFELLPVGAGRILLYASKGERMWRVEGEKDSAFLGSAQETVTAYAGQEVVWEPRLSLGLTIEGRVIYADGAPMQRVFVDARREGGGLLKATTTDALGEFSIHNLIEGSYRVSVVQRGAPSGTEPLVREAVLPDSGPLELRAGFSKHDAGTGRVSIRFVDDGRRVEGEASVVFASAQNWFRAEPSDGVYTTTLRPGRYRPVAMAGDVEVGDGPWFDLRSGDDLDLGTLLSGPGGDLLVRVNRENAPDGDLEILVHAVDGLPVQTKNPVVLREGRDELLIENLSSGPAKVTLWAESCLSEALRVDIAAGAVTEASFDLRRGTLRDMEFRAKNARGAFDLTIRDASGKVVYEAHRDEKAEPREVLRYSIALPVGRFSIDARTGSGLAFEGEVEFESFEPLARTLQFELR